MKLVCGIDFETTGKEPLKDRITEVGAVIFDASDNWSVVGKYSSLVYGADYPPLSDEVIEITGITDQELKANGRPFIDVFNDLCTFVEDCLYFMAHNAQFDKTVFTSECARHNLKAPQKHWLCSLQDLKENRKFKSKKLAHLALDYGVTVNPKLLHRAVNDVELMGQMLAAGKFSLDEIAKFSLTPNIVVRAMIPKPWEDGGRGKDAAKAMGYSWQQPMGIDRVYANAWVKLIKEDEFDDEQRNAPFRVQQLKGV